MGARFTTTSFKNQGRKKRPRCIEVYCGNNLYMYLLPYFTTQQSPSLVIFLFSQQGWTQVYRDVLDQGKKKLRRNKDVKLSRTSCTLLAASLRVKVKQKFLCLLYSLSLQNNWWFGLFAWHYNFFHCTTISFNS